MSGVITRKRKPRSRSSWAPAPLNGSRTTHALRRDGVVGTASVSMSSPARRRRANSSPRSTSTADDTSSGTAGTATNSSSTSDSASACEPAGVLAAAATIGGGTSSVTGAVIAPANSTAAANSAAAAVSPSAAGRTAVTIDRPIGCGTGVLSAGPGRRWTTVPCVAMTRSPPSGLASSSVRIGYRPGVSNFRRSSTLFTTSVGTSTVRIAEPSVP